jgi:tRNA threonylcarbamoyladenosine biosynthesis protein TsaE
MKFLSKSREETKEIANKFLETLTTGETATVVALHGDLGAGKTTFTQEVGKLLGIEENMHSPTFVIEKIYSIDYKNFKNLIHIDAYRLEKESELLHLGWQEIIKEKENLIFIEWPERVSGIMPTESKMINFKFIDEETREIEIKD